MAGPEEEWLYFHGSGGDDINGDGLIDVGGSGNKGLRVYFQNPDGTFTDKSSSVRAIFRDYEEETGGLPFGWDFGDVDGDGKAEIVSADYGGGDPNTNPYLNNISVIKYDESEDIFNLHFLSNESNKLFDYGRGGEHVDIFDINNDGHNDIIVKGNDKKGGQSLESWINNGDGTFYAKWGEAFEGQYGLREFKMFDANNDGYLDIIPNSHGLKTGNTIFLDDQGFGLDYNQSIFFNDGTGSFARDISKSYIDLYTQNGQTVSYMKDGKFHIFGMKVIQAEWRENWNGNTFLLLEDVQIDLD